jgi:hypothetical protein
LIDKDKLKNQLTQSDIIKIVCSLGSQSPKEDHRKNLIFQTVCHNIEKTGSFKLYYYDNTKLFSCYTECQESFDIFDLITRNKKLIHQEWEFKDSIFYVMDFTGYNPMATISKEIAVVNQIDDWENFLNQYRKKKNITIDMPVYSSHVMELYREYYHKKWIEEGISIEAMKKFNIKFDVYNNKIIIPHYNTNGELIGIRGRSLNKEDIEQGRKYMPVKVENTIYSHPISFNLYGFSHNLPTIRKLRKALIVEGEKSVLKIESYYPNHNFSIAVCGDKISDFQKSEIINNVDEVIIGFDKIEEYRKGSLNTSIVNLRSMAKKFSPYVATFIIVDKENLLQNKDAPVDQGKEVLEKLMKNKIEIRPIGG